jgi:serine/threonine protein kinase/tetratricopeptide (TPR) repeat protein
VTRPPSAADLSRGVPLGPFVLEEPVGRGGMGAVWRGRHAEQGMPVAVKVLDTQVTEEELEESFKNEVHAVTRLDHPGVVWVFDIGQVDAGAAAASEGRLVAGCPYIAMEFASRGTLRDWGRLPWDGVRDVLLALLDALAHAHARGVIHQDLKPANVLVSGPEDLRPGLKLADFGIAHAIERRERKKGSKTAIGTVQYMAPEQIRAESWECGPQTDIYSLGNVAWQLLTGQIPFANYSGVALVRAQLEEQLPDGGIRAPRGFRDWLRRCLAKDPTQRFLRAADAADALMELADQVDDGPASAGHIADRLPTVRVDVDDEDGLVTSPVHTADLSPVTGVPEGINLATGIVSFASKGGRSSRVVGARPVGRVGPTASMPPGTGSFRRDPGLQGPGLQAPLSSSAQGPVRRVVEWRRPEATRRSLQLLGAGLKLWGVRRSPMVGRLAERDTLWEALQEVVRTGRPQAVVITGAAGTGKTRLGSWLGERAHELGVATWLRTRFFEGDTDGPVRRMWTRHLRMAEVEPAQRGRWLARSLGRVGLPAEAEPFAVLVGPGDTRNRHRQSGVMIRAMTVERPVIVLLDDVHVGTDGLMLASHLLDSEPPFPVLVVATARSEALVDRREERELVEQLLAKPGARELRIAPLSLRDHVTLVEEVLGLSPALASQVADRTSGNPLFVLHLIGDWIKRGILVLGPTGFDVRPGEVAELPAEMQEPWVRRVERVLQGMPEKARVQLERAATLGLHVLHREWALACDDPDGSWAAVGRQRVVPDNDKVRRQVLDRLVAGRLAEEHETGFVFAHGMIREAILALARPRLADHHRVCASTLRFSADREAAAERIGWHLLQAGELAAAIGPLMVGVVHRRDTAGARSAMGLLATAEGALSELGLSELDPRWAEAWQLRAMLCVELGELAEAERYAERVLAHERRPEWTPHALDARLTLARLRSLRGDLEEADAHFDAILERSTDPVQQGLAHAERALVAARRRDRAAAKLHTDQAVRLLRRAASSRALAECWRLVGLTALHAGNDRQTEDALSRGLRLYRTRGNVIGQAECLWGLGRTAIRRGEHAPAEERLREAIHLYEIAGNSDVARPRADLARLWLEQRRYDDARDLLAAIRLQITRQGRVAGMDGLGAMQLAAAAGCMDWEEFDHRFSQIQRDVRAEVGDHGRWALNVAADLAGAAGEKDRAGRVRTLSSELQLDSARLAVEVASPVRRRSS